MNFTKNLQLAYLGCNVKIDACVCSFPIQTCFTRDKLLEFYLVGILLLVFDLELVFLFPWAVSSSATKIEGLFGMLIFFAIIMLGFVYELRAGALTWRKEN